MRPALAICVITLACGAAVAEVAPEAREQAVERLLAVHESPAAFEAAAAIARRAGVGDQGILEARFLFHVDRREDAKIAALAPEFVKRRDTFNLEESEIFAHLEDWLAVVEYTQALAALEKNDAAAFKTHITEAFWLSPGQAAAFAPHIERLRLQEAMQDVRVDFATRLATLHGADARTLEKINADSAATLLYFWSPWSRECEATMPDFFLTATELASHNIAVISILPEQDAEVRTDAIELLEALGENPPGTWLVDRNNAPLSQLLRIRNLPTFVLLTPTGTVLFNGHPADPEFWNQITTVTPTATRPKSP